MYCLCVNVYRTTATSTRRNHVPWGRLSPWKWVPGISLGVKAAGAYGWRPTILVMPNVKKIRGLNLPGTPWATSACCGMTFSLLLQPGVNPIAVNKYIISYTITYHIQYHISYHILYHIYRVIYHNIYHIIYHVIYYIIYHIIYNIIYHIICYIISYIIYITSYHISYHI